MAKYQFKVEINPPAPEGDSDAGSTAEPTIAQVADALEAGLESAYPDAEVRVYDGSRPDRD